MSLTRKQRNILLLLSLGFVAGTLGGLLGIGGGSLVVPLLVFFLGISQRKAHGTSLVVALCLALSGGLAYAAHGKVDLLIAIEMAVGGVVGALIGVRYASSVQNRTLRIYFCIFLALVGIRMILTGVYPDFLQTHIPVGDGLYTRAAWYTVTGIVTGLLSAILGIGGGMVMIPAMVVLMGVTQHLAQGISLLVMVPTAFTGAIMHHRNGNVELRVAMITAIGAVIGAQIGSLIAVDCDPKILQICFGVLLGITSALMAVKKN